MLNIFFGDMSEAIYNTVVYFKNVYEEEWIVEPLSKEMIRDVDHSIVLSGGVIDSPVLGKISPLSLILIEHVPDQVFNASMCGDNCAKWLLKMAENKDITINLRHIMDFGENSFCIHILNTDQIVHNMEELILVAGLYV